MLRFKTFVSVNLLFLQVIPNWSQQFYGISLAGQQQLGRKKLIIHHVGQCADHKDLPIFVPDMRVAPLNSTTSAVSGSVHFREDFPTGWDVSLSIRKCDNFRPDGDCRPFMDHLISMNQCTMGALFGDLAYMKYLKNLQPKAECPFRKGNYTFGETPVDDELVRFLPGDGATFWIANMVGSVGQRMVLCVSIQMNVKPKKNMKRVSYISG